MDTPKTTILTFNGHDHRLRAILGAWDQFPVVDIPSSELNDLTDPEFIPNVSAAVDTGLKVLFFKQKGKYTVLIGRDIVSSLVSSAKQFKISGRLISSPSLKSARESNHAVDPTPTAPVVVTLPPPRTSARTPSGPLDRHGDVKVKPRNSFLRHRAK